MLNASDVLGTPYRLLIDSVSEEYVLIQPPTIKYFEALTATYNVSLSEAISPPDDIEDEVTYIKVLSRTMQMLHIAAYMIDSDVTFEQVESWCRNDSEILTRYLKSFAEHLPQDNKKTKSVITPKKHSTPKIWIPR